MQKLVAGLLVASSASPAMAKMRDWKIFQMPPMDVQQRQAEIFDPYPMRGVAPIDDTVRPREYQHGPPEATRGRWPAPGTFPRVRLPADTHPKVYPQGHPPLPPEFAPPIDAEVVPPPKAARGTNNRPALIQPESVAKPQAKYQAQSRRRVQPE